jgi:hypothetical protein
MICSFYIVSCVRVSGSCTGTRVTVLRPHPGAASLILTFSPPYLSFPRQGGRDLGHTIPRNGVPRDHADAASRGSP